MIFCLIGCKNTTSLGERSRTGMYFDTYVTITVMDEVADTVMDETLNMCTTYENLFSASIPQSDISKINASRGETVKISQETMDLLKLSKVYYDKSDKLYDPSIFCISKLYNFDTNKPSVPDDTTIDNMLKYVNYDNIKINNDGTIQKSDPETIIELGAIAKGYIADKIKEYLISQNVSNAIINLGGEITTIGNKNGLNYTVGIADPKEPSSIISKLSVADKAVATSGTYERCFVANGITYHHIIDPVSGRPADTDIKSATIVTDNCADADALCTICILSGLENSLSLIESIPDCEAVFIDNNNVLHQTSGAKKFLKQ